LNSRKDGLFFVVILVRALLLINSHFKSPPSHFSTLTSLSASLCFFVSLKE